MKLHLTLVVCLISALAFAQNINGVVLDAETKQAIVSAHISIKDEVVAVTNAKGEFSVNVHSKSKKAAYFSVSHLGYVTKKVQLSKDQNKKMTIYLNRDTSELTQVVIAAEKKLQAKINYTEKASLKKGLYDFAAGIYDGKIYVVGGDNSQKVNRSKGAIRATNDKFIEPTFEDLMSQMDFMGGTIENVSDAMMIYDIEKDVWKTSDKKFRERTGHNLHIQNEEMYVIGGKRDAGNKVYLENVIEIYDFKSATLKEDTPNPHQAVNFASFSYGDYLILLGGIKKIKRGKKYYTKDIHFYNRTSGLWYKLGEMPTGKETQGVLINDVIYVIGGYRNRPLNTIESFNLKTGKWHIEGELFSSMQQPAIAHYGSIIFIYNDQRLCTYNVITKELNEYLIDLKIESPKLLYHNNSLFLVGGILQDGFYSVPSEKVFQIDISEFSKTQKHHSKKTKRKDNL